MANAHFWIGTIGMLLYVMSMYAAGVTQGLMWRAFDEAGRLLYPDFMETVIQIVPMYWVRFVGGTLYLIGAILLSINLFMTARSAKTTQAA